MDKQSEVLAILSYILEHWQMIFIFALKYLSDISKTMAEIKTTIKVHETHIEHFNNHLVEKH